MPRHILQCVLNMQHLLGTNIKYHRARIVTLTHTGELSVGLLTRISPYNTFIFSHSCAHSHARTLLHKSRFHVVSST